MFLKLEIKLTQSLLDLVRYSAVGPDLLSLTNSVSSEACFFVHVPVPLGQSYISFMSNVISWNQWCLIINVKRTNTKRELFLQQLWLAVSTFSCSSTVVQNSSRNGLRVVVPFFFLVIKVASWFSSGLIATRNSIGSSPKSPNWSFVHEI